jgi:hypothetical protein
MSLAIGRGVEEMVEEPTVPNKLLRNDINNAWHLKCLARVTNLVLFIGERSCIKPLLAFKIAVKSPLVTSGQEGSLKNKRRRLNYIRFSSVWNVCICARLEWAFISFFPFFFVFFFCFKWDKLLDNNNTVDSTVGKYQLKLLR